MDNMIIIIFILGLLLGSFYNVVGIRLLKKESIVKPRSHCPKCNYVLKWYENIPVLSYIFLKGKCSNCKEKISLMYPLMELLTAVLFVISYLLFGISENFFIAIIISSLITIIFITDIKDMIILDEVLVTAFILIFIIKIVYGGLIPAFASVTNGFILFLIMYGIKYLGDKLFQKESLGGGDIKLSFIAGMTLGSPLGMLYIVLGAFLALPYAIYVSLKNNDNILPFGPFLVVSLYICFCNSESLLELLKIIMNK